MGREGKNDLSVFGCRLSFIRSSLNVSFWEFSYRTKTDICSALSLNRSHYIKNTMVVPVTLCVHRRGISIQFWIFSHEHFLGELRLAPEASNSKKIFNTFILEITASHGAEYHSITSECSCW